MNNNDIALLIDSHIAIIILETYDESMAIQWLSSHLRKKDVPALRWSLTDGLGPLGLGVDMHNGKDFSAAEAVLGHIKTTYGKQAFVLCDIHPFLDEPKVVRLLKDFALSARAKQQKVILISHHIEIPPELMRLSARVSLSMPNDEEIMAIIRDEARSWANKNKKERIKTDSLSLKKLVNNLQGLPHQDVRRLAHGAIADDGAITESDLPLVSKAKFELMNMEGVLHYEFSTEHFGNVAGLTQLKSWLDDRKAIILGKEMGSPKTEDTHTLLDIPKGVLLFGVQGGGKSLAAKAIAGTWGLPLLSLDMGALFNKFIGETEKNLREALKLADLMSPCILWIDEIEKGLSQEGGDNAVSKRLLGTLLTWMSERKSRVFIVATSNDISQLPPELIRKGRFDETFFIDLPCQLTREAILDIHLRKRKIDLKHFDLSFCGQICEGYTGAEIEQAIVSASYQAAALLSNGFSAMSQDLLIRAIQSTQPLSILMEENIIQLREWAKDRSVSAH